MWIIAINGEDPITAKGALDELNFHQTPRGKSKAEISIYRRKSYQRKEIEDICSIFDQVRPVVSHIEICLPEELPTPNNIVKGLKGPRRKLWKESLSLHYDKENLSNFFWIPYQPNP